MLFKIILIIYIYFLDYYIVNFGKLLNLVDIMLLTNR